MILNFRAWHKDWKVMCKVCLIELEKIDNMKPQSVMLESKLGVGWFPIESVILMQSTSLNDKNGKEIFEGDIIRPNHEIKSRHQRFKVVKWIDSRYRVGFNIGDTQINGEIKGNIYENPELLKRRRI